MQITITKLEGDKFRITRPVDEDYSLGDLENEKNSLLRQIDELAASYEKQLLVIQNKLDKIVAVITSAKDNGVKNL